MKRSKITAANTEAVIALKKVLKPGQDVYGIVVRSSRSNLSRSVALCLDHEGRNSITMDAANALGLSVKETSHGYGIFIYGVGMDMAAHLIGLLAEALFGDYYALNSCWKTRCAVKGEYFRAY